MSRQQPSGGDSLRTRRLSTAANHQPQSGQLRQAVPGSRAVSNSGGPPAAPSAAYAQASSSSAARARTPETATNGSNRAPSNVGAKLLKKRQSVSYSQAVHDGYDPRAGIVPAMPALPSNLAGVGASGAVSSSGGNPSRTGFDPNDKLSATGLDVEQLAGETFKPEDFLKQNLTGPSKMDELKQFKSQLENAMKITETELQKSVFKNYADFVVISKEIATLENEMLELKSVLEEWRAVPESLEGGWAEDDFLIPGASSTGGPNRRTQRNSIADLASLYKTQLAALWEGVEGSQKLLPYVAGRHVITESASFVELNSATYKPKQAVHLFLLNDAMLVAVKKRRGAGQTTSIKLVAERIFNLSEIVVVDLKDAGELISAVKIKRGKETIIFKTDKPEDKKLLLLAFKKVAEELINKKRKEMLSEAEARKGDISTLRGGAGIRPDYDDGLSPGGFSPSSFLGFSSAETPAKDLSWIGEFSDELSVKIATRAFESATELVEKGKSLVPHLTADPVVSSLFRSKLDARSAELVTSLLADLSDHSIRKTGVVKSTSWLLRLNQAERAREIFLAGRGNLVRKRARQIKFEGDISLYVSELAMVTFTLIKNTCEWYMAAFKDNRMASGFVRWASEQVETYANSFRRQVYGLEKNQEEKIVSECLLVTKAHGAMLRDVGLDFTFLLDGLLKPDTAKKRIQSEQKPQPRAAQTSHVELARKSIFVSQNSTASHSNAARETMPSLSEESPEVTIQAGQAQ